MEELQRSTCLVCCGDITTLADSKRYVLKSTISKHIDVIFILKYIFELPSDQLSLYLRNCPNIEQWITICGSCDDLIDSFKAIYYDLLDVERMFRATKQRIVDMAKDGYNNLRDDRFQSEEHDELDIMDTCRRFISQHFYTGLSNPFAEGDAKAQELLNKKSSDRICQQVIGEEGVEEFQNFDDFINGDEDDVEMDWKPKNPTQPKGVVRIGSTKRKASKKRKLSYGKRKSKKCEHKSNDIKTNSNKDADDVVDAKWEPLNNSGMEEFIGKQNILRKRKLPRNKPKYSTRASKLKYIDSDDNSDSDANVSSNKDDEPEAEWEPGDNSEMDESPDEFEPKSKNKHYKKRGKRMIKKKWDGTKYLISCPTCGKMLCKFKLARHNRIHGPHQCDLCPNNFRSETLLHTHRIQVHNMSSSKPKKNPDGSVTCTEPNCNITVSSYKELERHIGTKHKEAPQLTCTKCDAKFYTSSRYSNHRLSHIPRLNTPVKSFICEHCGAGFYGIESLNFHKLNTLHCKLLYQTEAEATVVCDQCGKRLGGHKRLSEHIKRVHSEKAKRDKEQFNCEQCGVHFELKTRWKLHLFEVHQIIADNKGSKKNFYKCTEPGCDKVFRENKRLQDHLSKHRVEPQYECDECSKKFYAPHNLNNHKIGVHSKERVKCEICGKESSSKLYLQRHKCIGKNDADPIDIDMKIVLQ